MDTFDAILATLQINIALGILYRALPAARYRERLFERLKQSVKGVSSNGELSKDHRADLMEDREFTIAYHKASAWLRALPPDDLFVWDLQGGTALDLFQLGTEQKPNGKLKTFAAWYRSLPLTFRWFRSNADRSLGFFVATVAPIVAAWPVIWCPAFKPYWGYVYAGLVAGQAFLAINVALGVYMVWRYTRQFASSLGYVTASVERVRTRDAINQPPAPHH